MKEIINSPLLGVVISLIAFEIGNLIYKKTKLPLFNPLFISIILIIIFLKLFNIDVTAYNKGGDIISFFLGPTAVILAVPLYKKINILKQHLIAIIIGIFTGSTVGMTAIILLCILFKLPTSIDSSMVPKSVTVPIGLEISKQLGGIPSITVAAIIVTGIIGAVLSPYICRIFRIKDSVAVGIAIGTSSHALGTSKAMEIGEVEGAMSGLAIGVAGLITTFTAPILINIIHILGIK